MSQSNNRVSYASIAGRSATNSVGKPSCCSPQESVTQGEPTVVDEEEYPPIGTQTGAIKPKNDKKKIENITNTINIESSLAEVGEEAIESEKEENLPDLSQLSLDESSKTDSPRSKNDMILFDSGVENNNEDPPLKTWAGLFKKPQVVEPEDGSNERIQTHARMESPVRTESSTAVVDESEGQVEKIEPEDEKVEAEEEKVPYNVPEEEPEPSCSKNIEPMAYPLHPPIETYQMQYQMPAQMSYIQMAPMNPTYATVPQYVPAPGYTFVPATMPMVQAPYLPNYMPIEQTMMPVMQTLPYNAIAYQGMVYFQYDNAPMPPEAFQAPPPPPMPIEHHPPPYVRGSYLTPAPTSNNASDHSSHKPSSNGDNWASAVETMRFEQKIANKMDLVICNRYQVYLKINRGSCGSVFAAVDLFDPCRRTYAIKFEDYVESRSNLIYEYEVYKACSASEMNGYTFGNQVEGFARVFWMGQQYKYRILIMQLLGPSLENLFSFSMRQFSPETIYQLGNQMLNRIEHLHHSGFVHRDIKPENFAVGIGPLEKTIFLIDFGLSRRMRINPDNKAVVRKDKSLVGTAKYASMNSHKGWQLSRRDDMESIAYILLEFMHGDLPWKPENWRNVPRDVLYKNMLETKKATTWSKYPEMAEWLNYIYGLEFNDKPDYNYLRSLLTRYRENSFAKPQRVTPLSEHLASVSHVDGASNSRKKSKGTPQKMDTNHNFEWIVRRESCPNDRYSYECLYRWTLPYGIEPQRPPGDNPSNVFGYGFGEGGFA